MRVLVSGGCKMGKSTLAQCLTVAQPGQAVYIATMRPRDAEDYARIARHRAEREGWGFTTLERSRALRGICERLAGTESLLVDSTTALLAEEMFMRGGECDMDAPRRVLADVLAVAEVFASCVFVSDTIYADAMRYGAQTEAYRKGLADIDRALAKRCDAVVEMAFGQRILHKGDDRVVAWLAESCADIGHGGRPVHGDSGVLPMG